MQLSLLRRSSALIVAAILLAIGCAAPIADWRPLKGQTSTQTERDWTACQPRFGGAVPLDGLDVLLVVFLAPYYQTTDRHREAIARCMEQAGYEKRRGEHTPSAPVEALPPLGGDPDVGLDDGVGNR